MSTTHTQLMNSNFSTTSQDLKDTNGANMSLASPSIEEMNRIISYGAEANAQAGQINEEEPPAFGTHIREAIEIVKDWNQQER